MFNVRSLERVSKQRQKPSVGGVFLVIVIQTYTSLNDLHQHHKHPQFTRSCLLQQSSNAKWPSVISSQRSCKATRICLRGHRASFMQAFPPGGIPLADGTWVEERFFGPTNATVYKLVNAPSASRKTVFCGIENLGYRRSCYDPCILLDG